MMNVVVDVFLSRGNRIVVFFIMMFCLKYLMFGLVVFFFFGSRLWSICSFFVVGK